MAKNDNLKDFLTDVADAIRAKKGTSAAINPQNFSAEIASIETGGGGGSVTPVSSGAITFRDYDGTPLYSYTKDTFLALAEMPTLPTQKGLICQGWNYSLEDAKAYVEKYGTLDVGATYITDDGKTRFYITIATEGRMEVPLKLQQSVSNGVVVDWGDGSASETFSGTSSTTLTHTYSKVGDYVITFEVLDGTLSFVGSSSYGVFASEKKVYSNMLQKVEIGNGVTSIGDNAFYYCYSLASIVIPEGVTSISNNAFYSCSSLSSIVIPEGVTSIGNNAFYYCYSLASIVIPEGVTSISNNAFYSCSSLSSIVIPEGVTSIGDNAFYYCYSLASIVIPEGVTSIGSYAFGSCFSLSSIVIPEGVTSISNNAFYYCYSLASIVIPEGVTSIGNNAFTSCYSLSSIVIPEGVTSIGSYAFRYCSALAVLDFSNHTSVPTLSSTNAFSSVASDLKIVVPDALYDTWIAATNWSTYASKIIKASEFNG